MSQKNKFSINQGRHCIANIITFMQNGNHIEIPNLFKGHCVLYTLN